jgi:hypothetical protein
VKSLFDEKFCHTEEAGIIHGRAVVCLRDLFDDYVGRGYSPREIAHIICGAVMVMESGRVLRMAGNSQQKEEV